MAIRCQCGLPAAVETPTALLSGSGRVAHSVLPSLAPSLTAYITTFSPHAQFAGIKNWSLCLTDLVYADDICLMTTSTAQLQALIDALAAVCQTLHMQISVAKMKPMLLLSSTLPPVTFTCGGQLTEEVQFSSNGVMHLAKISHLTKSFEG